MTTGTKVERPLPLFVRTYKTHRKIIKKWADKYKLSNSEIVRRALEEYDTTRSSLKDQ